MSPSELTEADREALAALARAEEAGRAADEAERLRLSAESQAR